MPIINKTDTVPGSIDIQKLEITNFDGSETLDISIMVVEFNIYESISSTFITADFLLQDALSLTTTFPIVGQETIKLEFKTPHASFQKGVSLEMNVVSIQEVVRDNDRTANYILKCIMPNMIKDLNQKVRKAYSSMPINDMVKSIAEEYLGVSEIKFSEPTEGNRTITIPNMKPSVAINFLCKEAKNPNQRKIASNYRFYQNADGFHFKSIESMIEPQDAPTDIIRKEVYYASNMDMSLSKEASLIDSLDNELGNSVLTNKDSKPKDFMNVVSFHFSHMGDYYHLLRSGGLESKIRTLDPVTSLYEEKKYVYKDDFEKFSRTAMRTVGSMQLPKESPYYSEQSESRVFFLLSNRTQQNANIEPDQKEEMLHQKVASEVLHENVILDVTISGDSEKRVGEVIVIDFPEYGATDDIEMKINRFISGEYLILSLRHMYNPDGYFTFMTCSKNAFEKDVEDYNKGTNKEQ